MLMRCVFYAAREGVSSLRNQLSSSLPFVCRMACFLIHPFGTFYYAALTGEFYA